MQGFGPIEHRQRRISQVLRELLANHVAIIRSGKARAWTAASARLQCRPDLSNTAFLIEALKAAGAAADDQAIQKALVFVSRCQNLESEHNATAFAAKVNDGGFYFTCVLDRQGEERQTPEGGLRSYGGGSYDAMRMRGPTK